MVTFQSTLPRGSDISKLVICAAVSISIHAPSRERLRFAGRGIEWLHFNPRSLAGATLKFLIIILNFLFQSTLPRGSDSNLCLHSMTRCNFNPRSLAGATGGYNLFRSPLLEFQSTLPRGSDMETLITGVGKSYFNPRSLAGATLLSTACSPRCAFQSTLPRGSDVILSLM